MVSAPRIAIIGAGLAGLAAARTLREAGLAPVVLDKGRGVGGRLATRRAEGGLQFDHGAQYLSPQAPDFKSFLDGARDAGAAALWTHDNGHDRVVGRPGMSGIAKYLAIGTDIRQGVEVPPIAQDGAGWTVAGDIYDRVISTVPAPQAERLLSSVEGPRDALRAVRMEPNLTLMLAHPAELAPDFATELTPDDAIAWLALDSAKHGRPGPAAWVAQASTDWSHAHLELDKDEICRLMLPLVCARLGIATDAVLHAAAHRWRYAHASTPLGQPFLSENGTLFVGGDWALSNRAEGAWVSGRAMASALLDSL